jgi:hypothetical protein
MKLKPMPRTAPHRTAPHRTARQHNVIWHSPCETHKKRCCTIKLLQALSPSHKNDVALSPSSKCR